MYSPSTHPWEPSSDVSQIKALLVMLNEAKYIIQKNEKDPPILATPPGIPGLE